jgi:hypothetical protein
MSSILYYSNYCEKSKKYIKLLSNSEYQKAIHFICIDKRIKDGKKTFVVLENEETIVLPDTITHVPALLLLTKGYKVLFGEKILEYLQPIREQEVKVATKYEMEPSAFSFNSSGSNFGDISSDTFSYIQENPENLKANGNAGMKQLHNYATINDNGIISSDLSHSEISKFEQMSGGGKNSTRIQEDNSGDIMSKVQMQRDADIENIFGKRPPINSPF